MALDTTQAAVIVGAMPPAPGRDADWLNPSVEQHGLARYVNTIRERFWLVVLCVVLTTGIAALYVATAEKVYEAHADLLVTPISGDEALVGLGLLQESTDPTRDVSTAARYVETLEVARRVKDELKLEESPTRVLGKITAEPLAQSSVVTVTARENGAQLAADIANSFAAETVRQRTEQLRAQLNRTIPVLQERLAALPPEQETARDELAARVAALEGLQGVPEPTIRVITPASAPEKQAAPRPVLSIAAGLFAGLILGLGGAFALQAFDPRLRREEQLRSLFRLPILARIPGEQRAKKGEALAPEALSSSTFESYRTLRASLAASLGSEFHTGSVLVTGSSPGEGKTTTAINLAHALVAAGNKVILIEADVHRPTIGPALKVRPRFGLSAVLIRQVSLADALVTTDKYGPDLQLLLVDRPGPATADRLSLPTARQLVAEAEELADYVIIDSPPLTEVIDTLPIARQVAGVLVVARLNRTKLRRLAELGELLAQNEIEPAGVALVGVDRGRGGYYYTGSGAQSVAAEPEPART
jgi:capsular exopolysaccharide synthesis family protein